MDISVENIAGGIAGRYGFWSKDRFWSIDDWRKHLLKTRGKSRWNIIPQKVVNSAAYFDLSFSGKAALIAAYNIVGREKIQITEKRKRKPEHRYLPFMLPLSMLRATGFKTDTTAVKAIRELIDHGFIRVVEKRTGMATIYEFIEDYTEFRPLQKIERYKAA
jgi:hypothetical protein